MKNRGFTLLELMVSIAVLTIVSGALYTASMTLTQAARSQEAKTATIDHVQGGMLLIARNIRQASSASVNWGALPGPVLSYRAAAQQAGVSLSTCQRACAAAGVASSNPVGRPASSAPVRPAP